MTWDYNGRRKNFDEEFLDLPTGQLSTFNRDTKTLTFYNMDKLLRARRLRVVPPDDYDERDAGIVMMFRTIYKMMEP